MMKNRRQEKVKSYILITLIMISVIQVGIHWSLQAQGFPFRFITQVFDQFLGNRQNTLDNVKLLEPAYFRPDNITVSISSDQWILPKNNRYYNAIWNDLKKTYLPSLYTRKPDKILAGDEWRSIISETCTRIDFKTRYPNSLVTWLQELKPSGLQGFDGIKSIAVLPQKNPNETINTVYVYDEKAVYEFNVSIGDNSLPKRDYRELPEALKNQDQILASSAIGDYYPTLAVNTEIPIQLDPSSSISMQRLAVSVPEALIPTEDEDNHIDSIQEAILLNQKNSLMAEYDEDEGLIKFSDTENVYSLDVTGLLLYSYLPSSGEEAVDVKSAFIQAITFIEQRKKLTGDVDIVLSGIAKEGEAYRFTFDYEVDGFRVLVKGLGPDKSALASAISIMASSTRVLDCTWVIRTFNRSGGYKRYNNSFIDLVEDKIRTQKPGILKNERFESIEEGYVFDFTTVTDETLSPNWILKTNARDSGWYDLPLSEEE